MHDGYGMDFDGIDMEMEIFWCVWKKDEIKKMKDGENVGNFFEPHPCEAPCIFFIFP